MVARHVLCVLAMAIAAPVRADSTPPWVAGVAEAQKAEAKSLLDEGNRLFLARSYAEALEIYRRALAVWDHPAIRFNVVRCLIQLDRPVEAADNLERTLAYGPTPLQPAVYDEAQAYQKLLANQIGELMVRCTDPGIALTLDGKPLATCPASEHRRVALGPHQVVGAKPGFLTRTTEVFVLGGKRELVTMSLVSLEHAGTITHRWPIGVPWLVLGSGLAVTGIGGLLQLKAAADMNSYDRAIRQNCRGLGCDPGAVDGGLRARAIRENQLAIGLFAIGAATAVVGGSMLYLNRAHAIYPAIDGPRIGVTPTRSGASLVVRGAF